MDRKPGCIEREEWLLLGTDIYVGTKQVTDRES